MRYVDSFYICKHLLLCVYDSMFTVLPPLYSNCFEKKKSHVSSIIVSEATLLVKGQSCSSKKKKKVLMKFTQIYLAVNRFSF